MPTPIDELPPAPGWDSVRHWRRLVRNELIHRRTALDTGARRDLSARACSRLMQEIDLTSYPVLGIYWPIRAEFDVRGIAKQHLASGGQVALPVVVEKSAPIEFWRWHPGIQMQTGIWNIPIPKEREVLMPNALIVPLVGFDGLRFRLGYGGGYYDRALAAATPRPYAIGLGYADSVLRTIYPQRHDIPMDVIVTEQTMFGQN